MVAYTVILETQVEGLGGGVQDPAENKAKQNGDCLMKWLVLCLLAARCLSKFSPLFLLSPFHTKKAETLQRLRIICFSFPVEHWVVYIVWSQYFGLCYWYLWHYQALTGLYSGYRELYFKVTISLSFICTSFKIQNIF